MKLQFQIVAGLLLLRDLCFMAFAGHYYFMMRGVYPNRLNALYATCFLGLGLLEACIAIGLWKSKRWAIYIAPLIALGISFMMALIVCDSPECSILMYVTKFYFLVSILAAYFMIYFIVQNCRKILETIKKEKK